MFMLHFLGSSYVVHIYLWSVLSSISLSRCSGGHGLLLAGHLDDWGNGWCYWASWGGGGGVGRGMKPLCSFNAHKENPQGPRLPWWLPRPINALSEVREGRWDEDDLASDLGEPVGMVVQTFSGQCRGWPEEIHLLISHPAGAHSKWVNNAFCCLSGLGGWSNLNLSTQ